MVNQEFVTFSSFGSIDTVTIESVIETGGVRRVRVNLSINDEYTWESNEVTLSVKERNDLVELLGALFSEMERVRSTGS